MSRDGTSEVRFTIPGTPVPFARSGANGKVRFTPGKQRSAMVDIRLLAQRAMAGRDPLSGPVSLQIVASYIVPQSWSARKRADAYWKTSKPDGDNLQKLIKDACNRIVWLDDAQVVEWSGKKVYGPAEHTTVTIRALRQTIQRLGDAA